MIPSLKFQKYGTPVSTFTQQSLGSSCPEVPGSKKHGGSDSAACCTGFAVLVVEADAGRSWGRTQTGWELVPILQK